VTLREDDAMNPILLALQLAIAGWLLSVATPEPFTCTPDTPDGVPPPVQPSAQLVPGTTISNDGIWAMIPDDGRLHISEEFIETSGEYKGWRGTKMMWTRGDGVVGSVIITGERLDAEAPAAVDLVYLDGRQYGTMGFTPTWLTFPSAGCWEITGAVGNHTLVFILEVVFVNSEPCSATPAA
jgi:hypothetical protein